MMLIPLASIPAQTLSTQINNVLYNFTIRFMGGIMVVTIIRDNIEIITNIRATPFYPLIPYHYIENGEGNFIFYTPDDSYPNYTQFGITQYLLYVTDLELGEVVASF